jgi:hypothetical protein
MDVPIDAETSTGAAKAVQKTVQNAEGVLAYWFSMWKPPGSGSYRVINSLTTLDSSMQKHATYYL